jgi:hypothetical protein
MDFEALGRRRIKSGHNSKQLQNFAPTGSNVLGPAQEYPNHRVSSKDPSTEDQQKKRV